MFEHHVMLIMSQDRVPETTARMRAFLEGPHGHEARCRKLAEQDKKEAE